MTLSSRLIICAFFKFILSLLDIRDRNILSNILDILKKFNDSISIIKTFSIIIKTTMLLQ